MERFKRLLIHFFFEVKLIIFIVFLTKCASTIGYRYKKKKKKAFYPYFALHTNIISKRIIGLNVNHKSIPVSKENIGGYFCDPGVGKDNTKSTIH